MNSITYRKLVDCIDNGKLVIREQDYSYDIIIKSLFKIKMISIIKGVNVEIVEKNKRIVNSLTDISTVLNIHNKKDKISFIYDKMCDYLDYDFIKHNKCIFKAGKCVSDRGKNYDKDCGCCRSKRGDLCKYLVDGHCSIRNLGCKFYICPTLKKRGLRYRNKDFPIFNCFCNFREKIVLRYTIFIPKEKVIERCLNHRW